MSGAFSAWSVVLYSLFELLRDRLFFQQLLAPVDAELGRRPGWLL